MVTTAVREITAPAIARLTPNMSRAQLEALFCTLPAPEPAALPDGPYAGALYGALGLADAPPFAWAKIAALLHSPVIPWRGKHLEGTSGGNMIVHKDGRTQLGFYRVSSGVAHDDEKPVVVLDYDVPENPLPLWRIRGELRELRDGVHFARMLYRLSGGPITVLYFTLRPLGADERLPSYRKGTLTAAGLRSIPRWAPRVVRALASDRIATADSERLMLAATSELQCRCCNWFHSELAARADISGEEIEALLAGDLGSSDDRQGPALRYALSRASSGSPSDLAEAKRELASVYGQQAAADIEALVEFVCGTNRLGNTFDALLSRLHGEHDAASPLWLELLVGAATWPLYSSIAAFTRRGKNPCATLSA